MRMRYFRLMYAFACTAWLVYFLVATLKIPAADRSPNPFALVYCALVVVILPAALGYWLIFKVLPLTGRLMRR